MSPIGVVVVLALSLTPFSRLGLRFARCGGAPRSFRGFDLQTGERRNGGGGGGRRNHPQSNGHGSADPQQQQQQQMGRSPFAEGMPFPDMGSPVVLDGYENGEAGAEGEEGQGGEQGIMGLGVQGGPGTLELDEEAATAAAGKA